MKYLKYSCLIFLCAILFETIVVSAYPSPTSYSFTVSIPVGENVMTEYRTKVTKTMQYYKNRDTFTVLNDPCTNCQISAKPMNANGAFYTAAVTKMGETKYFPDHTSLGLLGDYRLMIHRIDTTLIKTGHSGTWTING